MNFKKTVGLKLTFTCIAVFLLFIAFFFVITHFGHLSKEPEIEILPNANYDRTITVVADAVFDPFSFFGKNGEPTGYDVELLYAAANKMQVNIEFKLMNWDDCKSAVADGEAHMIAGNPFSQDGYEHLIQSRTLTNDPFVSIGRENFTSVIHLNNKKLATIEKSGCIVDFLEPYKLVENTKFYTSYANAVMSVVSGENDYAIVRFSVGRRILANLENAGVNVVGPVLANSLLCIGVNENFPELAHNLDAAIKELQDDGTIDYLTTKWLGNYIEVIKLGDLVKIYRNELFTAVIVIVILIAVAVFYVYRNKMVIKHAEEENKLRRDKLTAELRVIDSKIETARAEAATEAVMSSINYASKIQKSLLPPDDLMESIFSDYAAIWKPRDLVGGDIYWVKEIDTGTVLCVADCTGHGTPGALLTTLVISALESVIWPSHSADTAVALRHLDQRLAAVLHVKNGSNGSGGIADIKDGCDLALLFISKDGSVAFSSGHMNVFVCDGKTVQRFKGQHIFVGEGRLKSKDDLIVHTIPPSPDNKFYIVSDGLYEQPGGQSGKHFGIRAFERLILDNHKEKQAVIVQRIWESFEDYRGAEPRVDDVELITFQP